MEPMVSIALRAARKAGDLIVRASDELDRITPQAKGAADFVTEVDIAAEKEILYHLQKTYPDHGFLAEESGRTGNPEADTVWLIDPLIGNHNFARGYTQFAVSLACKIEGVIQHAAVVCPMTNEEFVASRGGGAQLNSRRLRVGKETELSVGALIGLNDESEDIGTLLDLQRAVVDAGARVRISGCAALDIVNTAADRLQGGWASNVAGASHSIDAAALILKEAGGLIGSELANPDYSSAQELLFANPKILKQMVKLRQAKKGA